MKRLFEFLLPERTHLKAVIAALVAIFLLSGVLAYQVHESQKARAELDERHITAFEGMALKSYTHAFETRVFNHLKGAFRDAINVAEKGGSADQIKSAIDIASMCSCDEILAVRDTFNIDFAHLESQPGLPLSVQRGIANTIQAQVKPTWSTGVFAAARRDGGGTYAFLRNVDKNVDRAWVFPLPPKYVAHITAMVSADSSLIPAEFTRDLPPDSLFRIEVQLPSNARVLATSTIPFAARPSDAMLNQGMFPGMKWRVGVLPRGREIFAPPTQSLWVSPNLLTVMMILIASVIFMAIALVRREEELHRLRSDLISGVSHELRTPLAQIRMFAETLLLGRTRTEAERRRSLEVIDQEARRLSHFVENMLQFAKGEGGRARIVPEVTSFAVEVRRAAESFAPMCQSRGVDIRTELEDGVTAPVDRAALRRIMLNLLENALKYGPDDQRITVGVAIFNDVVRLWVDDEGEGIPRNDRERVFDSFFRLNRELDRRVTGSGIGLAVVRQLAMLHGGRAWAEAAPGGGARLVVEFPDAYVRPQEEGTGWAVA